MVNVIITAPKGKMNSLILEEAVTCPDIEVVGTIGPKGRDYIGTEICGVKVYDDLGAVIDKCDLVVDFSGANIAMDVLDVCLAHNKALLEGSTGFTSEMNQKIEDASKKIPLLKAANTSFMVNVLMKMLEFAGLGIAYHAKPRVRALIPHQINSLGLDSALNWFADGPYWAERAGV